MEVMRDRSLDEGNKSPICPQGNNRGHRKHYFTPSHILHMYDVDSNCMLGSTLFYNCLRVCKRIYFYVV